MIEAAAIAVALAGCVMPPDAEYVQTPADQPPRIESASPLPYQGVVVQGPNCADQEYSANLTDPDLGDTLHWQYFIDYWRHPSQKSEGTPVSLNPQTQSAYVSFPVKGNDSRFDAATVGASEPHIVELIVADRPFAADPHADPAGGKVTFFTWTVRWTATTQCE